MGIKSMNLNDRNEKVYDRYFKGNKGKFSKWVNSMLDKDFVLDPEEAIRQQIKINGEDIERIETKNEALLKKLRLVIDAKEQQK